MRFPYSVPFLIDRMFNEGARSRKDEDVSRWILGKVVAVFALG